MPEPIFRGPGRQTTGSALERHQDTPSAAIQQMQLEVQRAELIAKATQALPAAYRQNPGAVLLAEQWARSRGVDTLTAIQTVAFIDGKPVVDAGMQRALAERAGYKIRVRDVTDDSATVDVVAADGEHLGSETFTMADARRQQLDRKPNWQRTPRNMLVARATTNALRWYAPGVVIGLHTDDDLTLSDPAAALASQPAQEAPHGPAEPDPPHQDPQPAPAPQEADVADAEVVAETPAPPPVPTPGPAAKPGPRGKITVAQLRAHHRDAGASLPAVLRKAAELTGREVVNLTAIADDQDLARQLIEWIDSVDWTSEGADQ